MASDELSFKSFTRSCRVAVAKTFKKLTKPITRVFLRQPAGYEKFISVRNDPTYVQYLHSHVWQHDDIYNLYFLYLNPILVFSAYTTGWPVLVIDFITLVIINSISEKARS